MKNRYLSTAQVATRLDLDRSRIKQLIAQGRMRGAIRIGRAWAIPYPPVILPVSRKRLTRS